MSPRDRPRPREAGPGLLVLAHWEAFVPWLLEHCGRWPRSARFSLTQRLENHALDVLELLVVARYQPRHRAGSLRDVDRLMTEQLRVPGYVRYMDDFVLFANERDRLREARVQIERRLAALGLCAKDRATMLTLTREGVPFLGFLLFPAIRRVRSANRQRIVQRWKHRLWQWRQGALAEQALADCLRSMTAHLEHGTTRAWRRRWCAALEGVAYRNNDQPGNRNDNVGFRPAQGVSLARRSRPITERSAWDAQVRLPSGRRRRTRRPSTFSP
jgi:hypothetical protein